MFFSEYRNITTYEYVVRQRQKAEEKEVKKVSAIQNVNDEIAAVCIDSQVIEAQQTGTMRRIMFLHPRLNFCLNCEFFLAMCSQASFTGTFPSSLLQYY